ncbi:hypothetical protein M2C68_22715, partial [Pseudomonas sp. BAgro211]|nr:hypothetical protein [Pseudomonas sp. BAgro211]
ALHHLDEIVGELTGTMTTYWLVPAEFVFPLSPGTRTYNLKQVLGSAYPAQGLQFPLSAYLQYPPNATSVLQRVPLD